MTTPYYAKLQALVPNLTISWVNTKTENFHKDKGYVASGTKSMARQTWQVTLKRNKQEFTTTYFGPENQVYKCFTWVDEGKASEREEKRFVSLLWCLCSDTSLIDNGEIDDALDLIEQGLCEKASGARTTYAEIRRTLDGLNSLGITFKVREAIRELLQDY